MYSGGGSSRNYYLNNEFDATPSVARRAGGGGGGGDDAVSRGARHPRLLATPASSEPSSKQQKQTENGTNGGGREFTPLLKTVVKPSYDAPFERQQQQNKPGPLLFDDFKDSITLDSIDTSRLYSSRKNPVESALKKKPLGKENLLGESSSIPLREQEELISKQQNEIFDLKLRIDFLSTITPDNVYKVAMQNVDLKKEIDKYVRELDSLKDRLDQVEKDKLINNSVSETSSRYLLKNQQISELNDKVDELEEEMDKLKTVIEEKEKAIDELEHERLDVADTSRSGELDKLHNQIDELQQENRQLVDEKEQLQDENDKLLDQKESLLRQNNDLQDDMEKLKEANGAEGNGALADLTNEIDSLKRSNRELNSTLLNLQQSHNQLESEINDKNNELEASYKEKYSNQQEILRQSSEIDHLNQQLLKGDNSKDRSNLLQLELNSKLSIISTLENEREALRTELLNVQNKYSSTLGELESVKILMKRSTSDSENYKKECNFFEQRLHEAQDKIERLNRHVNESIADKTHSEDMMELKNEVKRKEDEYNRKYLQFQQEKKFLEEKIIRIEGITSTYEQQQSNLLKDKSNIQQAISIEKSKHEQSTKSLQLEISQLKTTITNLNSDIKQLQDTQKVYKSLEKELQDKEDDIISSQSQLIAMEDLKVELENKFNQLTIAHTTLENTLTALREVNENERKQRLTYESDLRQTQTELLNLTRENSSLQLSKESFENKFQILEIKYDKLKSRYTEINESYLKAKSNDTSITSSSLVQKCKDFAKEIQRLRAKEQAVTAQLERYKSYTTKLKERASQPPQSKYHQQELKGMLVQMQYLKQVASRESLYRSDLEFMKRFFMLQIASYQACNKADLSILQTMGIYPDYETPKVRPKLKSVALLVIAAIRIKKRYEERDSQIQKKMELIDIRNEWRKNRQKD